MATHKIRDVSVLCITVVAKCPGDNDAPVQGAVWARSRVSPHSEGATETWLTAIEAWTCLRLHNHEAEEPPRHPEQHFWHSQPVVLLTCSQAHVLPQGPSSWYFGGLPPSTTSGTPWSLLILLCPTSAWLSFNRKSASFPQCHSPRSSNFSSCQTHLFSLSILLILLSIRMTALSSSNGKHGHTWQQQKHGAVEAGGGIQEEGGCSSLALQSRAQFREAPASSLPAPPSSPLHPAVAGLGQVPVREILTSPLSHKCSSRSIESFRSFW